MMEKLNYKGYIIVKEKRFYEVYLNDNNLRSFLTQKEGFDFVDELIAEHKTKKLNKLEKKLFEITSDIKNLMRLLDKEDLVMDDIKANLSSIYEKTK